MDGFLYRNITTYLPVAAKLTVQPLAFFGQDVALPACDTIPRQIETMYAGKH